MSKKIEDSPMGIVELYSPPACEPAIDIVAVHGLSGDARKTWTAKSNRACWLSDPSFLPAYIKNARVLSWGYNSSFTSLKGKHPPSKERIHQHAQTLIANLSAERKLMGTEGKPIIFICHSLGGLVVKRALSYAQLKTGHKVSHQRDIFTSTYGILFFGTPHYGSSQATYLNYLTRAASVGGLKALNLADSSLVAALKEESETLQNITEYFVPIMKNFNIHYFWEQERTDLKFGKQYIVSSESAAPVQDETERSGIAATHSGMVKFESPEDSGFLTVMSTLQRYCDEAPSRIEESKAYEMDALHLEREREAHTILKDRNISSSYPSARDRFSVLEHSRIYKTEQSGRKQGCNAIQGHSKQSPEGSMVTVPRQSHILGKECCDKTRERSGTRASSETTSSRASTVAAPKPFPLVDGLLSKGRVLFTDKDCEKSRSDQA